MESKIIQGLDLRTAGEMTRKGVSVLISWLVDFKCMGMGARKFSLPER